MAEGDPSPSSHIKVARSQSSLKIPLPISFVEAVQGKQIEGDTNYKAVTDVAFKGCDFLDPATLSSKPITNHQGVPAIAFSTSEQRQLVGNLKWVIVGKFSHGKPPLKIIQAFFKNLKLQGDVNCALSDSKHIFIECSCHVDYYWIWMQLVLNIQGYTMRLFKWLPNFSAMVESPIAPVWIKIVGLALYLFEERTLLSIASTIGKPIKVDSSNINRTCLSYARVCVELDASKPLIDEIEINIVDDETGATTETMRAKIWYDVVPKFCRECSHIGHTSATCKRTHASSSSAAPQRPSVAVATWQGRSKQVWQQVSKSVTEVGESSTAGSALRGQDHQPRHTADYSSTVTRVDKVAQTNVAVISTRNIFEPLQIAEPGTGVVEVSKAKQVGTAADHLTGGLEQLDGHHRGTEVTQSLQGQENSSKQDGCLVQAEKANKQFQLEVATKVDKAAQIELVCNQLTSDGGAAALGGVCELPNASESPQIEEKNQAVFDSLNDPQVPIEANQIDHSDVAILGNSGVKLELPYVDQKMQNLPALTHTRTAQICRLEDTILQPSLALPRTDLVRPKSADSAIGKKKTSLNIRLRGRCPDAEPKRPKPTIKPSWADEVEEMDKQVSKPRMALEHSFQFGKAPKEGFYKNYLVLDVPGFKDMSTQQQKETAASIMEGFYQWKVTSDLEEEVRKESIVHEEPASEKDWQVVSRKKKRSTDANGTPKVYDLASKSSEPHRERHMSKARRDPPHDPEYKIEQLHARIQKMKRDSPKKRQLQSELKVLRGA